MLQRFHNLGIRWKVLLAPALLILALLGLGLQEHKTLRANQAEGSALMEGPLRLTEAVRDLASQIWSAHALLYQLTALAANETDEAKIKAFSTSIEKRLDELPKRVEEFKAASMPELAAAASQLHAASVSYAAHARKAAGMAEADSGSALMFMKTAQRDFDAMQELIGKISTACAQTRDEAIAKSNATLEGQLKMLPLIILGAVLAGGAVSLLVGAEIARPVAQIAGILGRIAQGDTAAEIPVTGRSDEIGAIASAGLSFKDSIAERARLRAEQAESAARSERQRKDDLSKLAAKFEAAAGNIVRTVSQSSTRLAASAGTLTKTADSTIQLANRASGASGDVSTNVQSIASAATQMSAQVVQIRDNVHESSRLASEAVRQAEDTDARIAELSRAAAGIGNVIKLIQDIAAQTNLLALNATIEAARAGEMGRGFAVVAHEVKELSAQTTKATGSIEDEIRGINAAMNVSIATIRDIGVTIGRISGITNEIAAAMDEQNSAVDEIARNVQQAAGDSGRVSRDIEEVNRGAADTGTASAEVLQAAQALSGESGHLETEVRKFLANIRAA
jgi:methyl-accepting chemotaxis protein